MELPDKKYQIIYADPPWEYEFSHTRSREIKDYNVCDLKTICDFPIKNIADKNSILIIWVNFPKLDWAFKVIEAWGFKYTTMLFTWIKTNGSKYSLFWGMGYYTRSNPELCLIAKKGNGLQAKKHDIHSVVFSSIKEHSRKPDEIRKTIVDLFGDVPRIELFARNRFDGWDCWGDQLSDTVQKELGTVRHPTTQATSVRKEVVS